MKFLFLIFLLVPLIEIFLLIEIGSVIGAALTIFLVVFTALLGAFLVRAQGFTAFMRAQSQMAKGQVPAVEMMEGLALFIAGALLLTPGFFTDAIGFLLLTPPLRRSVIYKLIQSRSVPAGGPFDGSGADDRGSTTRGGQRVIDGEFKNLD